MNSLNEIVSNFFQNSNLTTAFLDAALKSFIVLALAGGLSLCWRRASATTRHLIWFLAVASLPCLPMLSSMLPSWHRPLWSVSTGFNSGNRFSLALELSPTTQAGSSLDQTPTPVAKAGTSGTGDVKPTRTERLVTHFGTRWLVLASVAWSVGALLTLSSIVIARLHLHRLSRQAHAPHYAEWPLLLQRLCVELRIRHPVILLQSADNVMPATWGWWRPVILLPAAADEWPPERQRLVLQHELAHVKRWDCLTQVITRIVCAFYWFNPLVWLAARRMCIERERACDDLVLNGGCKASNYAGHLVEIARTFQRVPQVAAIAMARSSQLGKRVQAIVDAKRNRRQIHPLVSASIAVVAVGLAAAVAANKSELATAKAGSDQSRFDPRLQAFFAEKEKQARSLAKQLDLTIAPEIWEYFQAAEKGDWSTVTNIYRSLRKRSSQYEECSTNDPTVGTPVWQTIIETICAYYPFADGEKKYAVAYARDIINSIPPGGIYFGGTDPGRTLITAFSKSHENADPFFTLTQNALADTRYLTYLRTMYGGKIYTPSNEDLEKCFQDYMMDAQRRLREKKLKPGENVTEKNGQVQISGQVAVMSINGMIAKVIFDKNPEREFYIEESFALDWMYPYLEPHGLIMKINRQPLPEMSDETVKKDHDYWSGYLKPMIGGWLNYDTPVKKIIAFAEKVYLKQDLSGFKGDPQFVQNDYDRKMFSKLRSSTAGVYAWRMNHAASQAEMARMTREADFAFRQAWALCPYSPYAVYRYVDFLKTQNRVPDAISIAETAAKFPSSQGFDAGKFSDLAQQLKKSQKAD